jgi:hypothetical protein
MFEEEEGGWQKLAMPADDAPEAEFWRYWSRYDIFSAASLGKISERGRARLLPLALKHREALADLLSLLPDTAEAHDALKAVYDGLSATSPSDEGLRAHLHGWLMYHSRYFRDELVAAAAAKVEDVWGMQDVQAAQEALARLDWPAAERLLRAQAAGDLPRVAASALRILHHHAVAAGDEAAAEWRERLQRIATDTKAPGFARNAAFEALAADRWPGRAAWFTARLGDATLEELEDGQTSFGNPLKAWARAAPAEALPAACQGAEAVATRPAAAAILLEIGTRDALRPLLPALAHPQEWPRGVSRDLVRALQKVEVPGSGELLVARSRDREAYDLDEVGLALARQKAAEAPAVLKAALPHASGNIEAVLQALLDLNALTPGEIADMVEAGDAEALHWDALAAPGDEWRVAAVLVKLVRERAGVAEALIARSEKLRGSDAALAEGVWEDLEGFSSAAVDRACVGRLEAERLDGRLAAFALRRGARLREVAPEALRAMVRGGGARAGLAAAVLGDSRVMAEVLAGGDREAQRVLLAAGAVADVALPLEALGRAYEDRELAGLVEGALLHEDSAEARALVRGQHPGELLVLAKDGRFPAAAGDEGGFATPAGKHLPRLLKGFSGADGPVEIVALFSSGGFGEDGQRIVRIYKERATVELAGYDGKAGAERAIDVADARALAAFVREDGIDALPPLRNERVSDGVWYEYVHVTAVGGRLVFMSNPHAAEGKGTAYPEVVARIKAVAGEAGGQGR